MKLIPKKQKGGSFLSLFADYTPLQVNQPQEQKGSSSNTTKSTDDKGKLTEKDLFTLLKDVNGLPNEMKQLVSDIQTMYQDVSLFGNDFGSSNIANLYAQNIYKLKHANFNKEEYDKSYKEVEKNEGLNEYAVSSSGKVIVYDKDKNMTQVSVSEFLQNANNYQALTNSNLLWLRAHDPQFVNNNQIFDITNNGIGLNKIDELIRKRMSDLGTSESTSTGYTAKTNGKIMQGIQVLEDAAAQQVAQQGQMTLDGLYKTKVITKDQQQQAQVALKYIYQTLPDNAKAILQLRSGNSENPTQGALELIGNMIMSRTSNSQIIESTYQEDLNIDGTKKANKSLDDEDINIAQQWLRGYGNKEQFTINPGTNLATLVQSNAMQLVKKDGENLGTNCTLQEVSKGQFGGILDWNNVTMGGRKVDSTYFNQVMVEDGMVRSIDFPVDENGNPDLRPTTLEAKRKFDELCVSAGIDINDPQSRAQHSDEINQILEQVGLNAAYDSQGNIVSGNWKRFAVMQGIADNRALSIDPLDDSNHLLKEITDENRIDNLIQTIQDKTDVKKLQFDKNDRWLEGGYDMLMEGTIWIPVNVNDWNAAAGSGATISDKLGLEREQRQQTMDREDELMRQWKNPGQP